MGILSRKHRKNRGARWEYLREYREAMHTLKHESRKGRTGLHSYRWTMTPDERRRLAAYNDRHAPCPAWWAEVRGMVRKAYGLGPLTPVEAERAYVEARAVPLSEARIKEMVAYATGR